MRESVCAETCGAMDAWERDILDGCQDGISTKPHGLTASSSSSPTISEESSTADGSVGEPIPTNRTNNGTTTVSNPSCGCDVQYRSLVTDCRFCLLDFDPERAISLDSKFKKCGNKMVGYVPDVGGTKNTIQEGVRIEVFTVTLGLDLSATSTDAVGNKAVLEESSMQKTATISSTSTSSPEIAQQTGSLMVSTNLMVIGTGQAISISPTAATGNTTVASSTSSTHHSKISSTGSSCEHQIRGILGRKHRHVIPNVSSSENSTNVTTVPEDVQSGNDSLTLRQNRSLNDRHVSTDTENLPTATNEEHDKGMTEINEGDFALRAPEAPKDTWSGILTSITWMRLGLSTRSVEENVPPFEDPSQSSFLSQASSNHGQGYSFNTDSPSSTSTTTPPANHHQIPPPSTTTPASITNPHHHHLRTIPRLPTLPLRHTATATPSAPAPQATQPDRFVLRWYYGFFLGMVGMIGLVCFALTLLLSLGLYVLLCVPVPWSLSRRRVSNGLAVRRRGS